MADGKLAELAEQLTRSQPNLYKLGDGSSCITLSPLATDSYIERELHGWREPWRLAEAAKNICMERLMARVTVVKKKGEADEEKANRRAEQITDRL